VYLCDSIDFLCCYLCCSDPTATRLLELHVKEQESQAEAKAALLREYAQMVAEAEALNQSREELDKRAQVTAKLQVELDRSLGKPVAKSSSSTTGGGATTSTPSTSSSSSTAQASTGGAPPSPVPSSGSGAPAKLTRGATKSQLPTAAELLAASAGNGDATDSKKDEGCVVM
jgi:cobalamin biosynthesis Mg chelatase CobN